VAETRNRGELPTAEEIQRRARAKIRELEKKTGKKPRKLPPGANPELWPGGPSIWTEDIRIASRKKRRAVAAVRTGIA
jgi:hypothetical protein